MGLPAGLFCLNLAMPFGWLGSPGEYAICAAAAKRAHGAHAPEDPGRDDPTAFASDWLMDDGVLVEPLVGLRPWCSVACLEDCMRLCWGPRAINEQKKDDEGAWLGEQLFWGLFMDFQAGDCGQIRLPEPKRVKGQ